MKLVHGKITIENEEDLFVTVDGNKIPLNKTSLGNSTYEIGQDVSGVIADDNTFHICKKYHDSRKGNVYGFISEDDIESDFINITCVEPFEPKLISSGGGGYKERYEIGEHISLRRELINNY